MSNENYYWYCPGREEDVDWGLCWEFCFAGSIGPIDTTNELIQWIKQSKKFKNLKDFHKVCEKCSHCQWG